MAPVMDQNAESIDKEKNSCLSERDILIGIFDAVLALGQKLTGQKMTAIVRSEDGATIGIGASGSVLWGSLIGAEVGETSAPPTASTFSSHRGKALPVRKTAARAASLSVSESR